METIGNAKPIITKFTEVHFIRKRNSNKPIIKSQLVQKSTGLSPLKHQ